MACTQCLIGRFLGLVYLFGLPKSKYTYIKLVASSSLNCLSKQSTGLFTKIKFTKFVYLCHRFFLRISVSKLKHKNNHIITKLWFIKIIMFVHFDHPKIVWFFLNCVLTPFLNIFFLWKDAFFENNIEKVRGVVPPWPVFFNIWKNLNLFFHWTFTFPYFLDIFLLLFSGKGPKILKSPPLALSLYIHKEKLYFCSYVR